MRIDARSAHQRKRLLIAALYVSIVLLFVAAPRCYAQGQCPLHLPPKCQQISDDLDKLTENRRDLQAELDQATGSQKAAIASQIKKNLTVKQQQITAKEKQLNDCTAKFDRPEVSAILKAIMSLGVWDPKGVMTLQPSGEKGSEYDPPDHKVSFELIYQRWAHDQVVVKRTSEMSLMAGITKGLSQPYGTGNLEDNSNVQSNCGELDPKTGRLSVSLVIPVSVTFILLKGAPQDGGISNLSVTLSTEQPSPGSYGGSRIDPQGNVRLYGLGVFQDGTLKGYSCNVFIKGTLTPLP